MRAASCEAMWNRTLGVLAATLIAGCAADLASSRAPASTTPPNTVLVQAMVVEVPPSRIGDLGDSSFAKVAALPGVSVMTSPSLVVQGGVPATFESGPEPLVRLAVRAEILTEDDLWLDIQLTGDAETSASQLVHNAQPVILRANRPAVHGGTTLLVIRSDVIRDEGDLRRLRHERCSDCTSD
jgi:hypothetical protein